MGPSRELDRVQNQSNSLTRAQGSKLWHGRPVAAPCARCPGDRSASGCFRAVCGRPHGTADEVGELVRAEIGAVSRQAVYDALGILADNGLIRRIQPARSPARYEDRVDDNHHHLVCRTCGRTEDVECAVGHRPCLQAADDHGFIIDEAEVVLLGFLPRVPAAGTGAATQEKQQDQPHEQKGSTMSNEDIGAIDTTLG